MVKLTQKIITDKKIWENFVLNSKPSSFLQSWNWGETNLYAGNKIFRVGFFRGNKLCGVSLLIKQVAKRGNHLIIPGGPIIDWDDKKLVNYFFKTITDLGKREKVWFIRLRPELFDCTKNRQRLSKIGLVKAPMHLHAENTWILDLDKNEEQLLKDMRKSTRYLVKKSLNYQFSLVESHNVSDTKVLFELQTETAKRHGFVAFPLKLFEGQLKTFSRDGQGSLFLGKYKKKIISAGIFIFYGDTCYYHHSASAADSLNYPIQYYVQWQIIKKCMQLGIKKYNFWGISPDNNPKHRFYGVTLFKTGFGGRRVDWVHAYDLPLSPLYMITYIIEMFRKHLRNL